MKFLAIAAIAAFASVQAAEQSTIHVRVHAAGDDLVKTGSNYNYVAEWGQCQYNGEATERPCAQGLVCRRNTDTKGVKTPYYGQCLRNPGIMWGQCGGQGWTGECVDGAKCVRSGEFYAQCVPK